MSKSQTFGETTFVILDDSNKLSTSIEDYTLTEAARTASCRVLGYLKDCPSWKNISSFISPDYLCKSLDSFTMVMCVIEDAPPQQKQHTK